VHVLTVLKLGALPRSDWWTGPLHCCQRAYMRLLLIQWVYRGKRVHHVWPTSSCLTPTDVSVPFPQIDIIGAVVIVWRVMGKTIRSVLCNIVCNNCAQWV